MHRYEAPAKFHHFWSIDCGLQPRPMMEGCVPISNRSVILAKRKFEIVVVVVTNDGALDCQSVRRRFRGEADFSEVADLGGECRRKVQHKLSHIESTVRAF